MIPPHTRNTGSVFAPSDADAVAEKRSSERVLLAICHEGTGRERLSLQSRCHTSVKREAGRSIYRLLTDSLPRSAHAASMADDETPAGPAQEVPCEDGSAPTAVFFKRRAAGRSNLRKRPADEEEEGGGAGRADTDAEGPAVVRPSSKARTNVAVGGSTAREAERVFTGAAEAERQRQERGDGGATASLQSETPFDRDARAAREAVLAQASKLGADGREVDDGLYHGQSGYIDYRKGFRREHTVGAEKSGGMHGPLRAPTNVRFTFIMDYKPDICKDYKETGYCGFGDSCKFMHDRGDYKAGWQLDREWEEKERLRKEREKAALAGMLGEEDGGQEGAAAAPEDDLPFACFICRRPWSDVRDPVVTKCRHYFCEQCALQHNAKTKSCAACNVRFCLCPTTPMCLCLLSLTPYRCINQQPTGGVFNTAQDIIRKTKEGQGGALAERAAVKREARAAAQKEELARGGSAGWLLG